MTDHIPDSLPVHTGSLATDPAPLLAFDQVTFGYNRVPVLREASARVRPGEFVAVIGPNGSGKTTMLKLALGLLRPSHGTVRLFGVPSSRFDQWHRVGYVPQRASSDAVVPVSVEEVVRTGLAPRLGLLGRPDRAQRAQVERALEVTGLAGLRKQAVQALSGGQQQRTLIARALVTGPDLLLLDEPTTGVDAGARGAFRESLEHLVQRDKVAVVYVSHDPEGFAGLADRVLEVRAGHIVECEDPTAHRHAHEVPVGGEVES